MPVKLTDLESRLMARVKERGTLVSGGLHSWEKSAMHRLARKGCVVEQLSCRHYRVWALPARRVVPPKELLLMIDQANSILVEPGIELELADRVLLIRHART